jgi:hypothetical protein
MSRLHSSVCLALSLMFPALSCAQDDSPFRRGMRELGLSGIIFVTHDSPEDLFGVVSARGGIYVAKNHQVGIEGTVFAYSRVQDAYLSGYYRYFFARPEHRIAPFVGAGLGSNVTQLNFLGNEHSLIATGQGGLRFLLPGRFSLDVIYNLMYRRNDVRSFTGQTSSVVTFGFSRTF